MDVLLRDYQYAVSSGRPRLPTTTPILIATTQSETVSALGTSDAESASSRRYVASPPSVSAPTTPATTFGITREPNMVERLAGERLNAALFGSNPPD